MASLIFKYKYLSHLQLSGFDKYKYKSIDNSPLSNYVMHPFWNQLVKIFPLWVPANALTLSGWLCSLLCFTLCSYYDVHFMSSAVTPRWVWLVCGVCIFLAHQLDGCDGKQARRTNTGSPLGELFDHGLDSSTVSLMCISILSLFGINEATAFHWEITGIFMMVLLAFFLAHWEKYNTSVMFLPWAYDVSQIFLASAFVASYFYGTEIWRVEYFDGAANITFIFKNVFYFLLGFFVFPMSLYNQYAARKNTPRDCVGVLEGSYPLLALGAPTALFLFFGYISPNDIVVTQPRLFLACYGILYSNITCRLIIAQMTATQCDRFNILAWPLFALVIASYLKITSDLNLLLAYTTFATFGHLHYGINVVHQLCQHLNIYCFKVKKPKSNGNQHSNGHAKTNGKNNGISNVKTHHGLANGHND